MTGPREYEMPAVEGDNLMRHIALGLAALLFATGAAQAAETAKPKVDPLYLPYEQPGILAKIPNGQTLHIKCMGTGSPTVLLAAGAGGWASDWRTVQPQIAQTTRACALDRPGFGFSSGTMRSQTTLEIVRDFEAALKVAHISGPYVVVGHSLAGYESLLFADRNRKSVAGMVLVDPSIPGQFSIFSAAAPTFSAFMSKSLAGQQSYLGRCLSGLRSGKLKIGGKDPEGCLAYTGYPRKLEGELVRLDTNPARFTAVRSMLANFEADSRAVINPTRSYGDMPLIVLTATTVKGLPADLPAGAKAELPAQQAAWSKAHDAIAALSTRGENRKVPDASHYIQYDQPKVVIDAINEVVAKARAER